MKWLKRFFTKSEIRELSFHTGTDGMKKHSEFIDWVNESGTEIINSYITYNKYSHSHRPQYINYVIKIKRK
jgi:hypothetical protein